MRRMYSEKQLVKLIEEHGGGTGAVNSVNTKTGDVVLDATDIKLTTTQTTVQANIQRIDTALDTKVNSVNGKTGTTITLEASDIEYAGGENVYDQIYYVEGKADTNATKIAELESDKLDASKSAVSSVGGLVVPNSAPVADKLVGIDTTNGQELIAIGSGLSLSNGTLSATGGGSATIYRHNVLIHVDTGSAGTYYVDVKFTLPSTDPDTITTFAGLCAKCLSSTFAASVSGNEQVLHGIRIDFAENTNAAYAYYFDTLQTDISSAIQSVSIDAENVLYIVDTVLS